MDIKRNGAAPATDGPAEYFSGKVRLDFLFVPAEAQRVITGSVSFDPGARTRWHTHPRGQTLVVTAGTGRVQRWGAPVETIHPGDVVWIPAGEKHWHGATTTSAMTHIAIQEQLEGKTADWLEWVSDDQD